LREGGGDESFRPGTHLPICLAMTKADDEAIQKVRGAFHTRDSDYLLEALNDPVVRSWAARYLGKLRAVEAVPALMRLLRAADPKTRLAAADGLGLLQASEAVSDLASLAESDADVAAQTHAITALGQIGDVRTVPVLIRVLGSPRWMARACAAWALGEFADPTAIPALRGAARRERFFNRGVYRKAIRKIRRRAR
jgi:HEAT repeat protein